MSYIGNSSPGISAGTEEKFTFNPTGTQSVFAGMDYNPSFVSVFHNGVKLQETVEYTATDGASVTLTTAAENGDVVEVVSVSSFSAASVDAVPASTGGTFNGNVGIGVSPIQHSMHIVGGNNATELKISATDQGSGALVLGDGSSSSKNVGIYRSSANDYATNGNFLNFDTWGDGGFAWNIGNAEFGSKTAKLEFNSTAFKLEDVFLQFGANTTTPTVGAAIHRPAVNELAFITDSTERIRIDSSGNVGIGTSSPSATLDLSTTGDIYVGAGAATDPSVKLNDTNSGLFAPAGNTIAMSTAGSERMRIASDGNVGIGTTSPGEKLHVIGTALISESGGVSNDGLILLGDTITARGEVFYDFSAGDLLFTNTWANAAADIIFEPGNAESLRLTGDGNVGIGTSSPTSAAGVARVLEIEDTTAGFRFHGTTGNVGLEAYTGAALGYFGTTSNHGLALYTNNSEAVRIDSSGNVGINNTNPNKTLDVAGIIKADNQFQADTSDSAAAPGYAWDGDADTGFFRAGVDQLGFATGGSEHTRILNGVQVWGGTTEGEADSVSINTGGYVWARNTSQVTAFFDRLGTDGDIIELRKDGTDIGKIGVDSSRVTINSNGRTYFFGSTNFFAGNDNIVDVGSPTLRFDDVYATNGTINTSDGNEKVDVDVLSEVETRVAQTCKGLLRKFRWISSVEEKGDDARIHFGIIAQDLQAAFDAEGLDAGRYAMFISTTWYEDEDGNVYDEQNEEGTLTERSRLGVRYSELLAFIIAAL